MDNYHHAYDVSPDGRRFLMIERAADDGANLVRVFKLVRRVAEDGEAMTGAEGRHNRAAEADMIRTISLTLPLALAACTSAATPPTAAGHQPAEEAAILAVMDAYMDEISANDLAAMDARQTSEGMTYRFAAREYGGWDVMPRPNSYWVAPERANDHAYHERYWSPTVMIRGPMALVWAPYEFQIDGKTSHCGVDVFSFAKIDGVWKVSNSMWTVEPNGCAELRPENRGMIRPRD